MGGGEGRKVFGLASEIITRGEIMGELGKERFVLRN